jgi:DNA-binding LacI/PurR family transcriptional regulator
MGITIRDVAKHAGVSVATVSRYLNNSPLIAPDSVEKVRRSILELHYEPNFMARSMITRHSNMVALLVDNSDPETFGNESFLRIQYGMEHALAEHGYYLMILSIPAAKRACSRRSMKNAWTE